MFSPPTMLFIQKTKKLSHDNDVCNNDLILFNLFVENILLEIVTTFLHFVIH